MLHRSLPVALTSVFVLGLALWTTALASTAHAQSVDTHPVLERVPEQLRPWAVWVTRDRPDLACPWTGSGRACVWHGSLDVETHAQGAVFSMGVRLDAEGVIRLPGDTRWWPSDVRANGNEVVMHLEAGGPALRLGAGAYVITGHIRWERTPDRLPVPTAVGVVRHREVGDAWRVVHRSEEGSLTLRPTQDVEEDRERAPADTLELDVIRLLTDDVPQRLETRIRLRAGGAPREVTLSRVLPEGFQAIGIDAPIPTEFTADGGLTLQLRPGDWTATVIARSQHDLTRFQAVTSAAPWPTRETWALDTGRHRRTVEPRGVSAIDPRQTSAPPEWHHHPVFSLQEGEALELLVLHRGESAPPAPLFRVQRDIRLSFDGKDFLIRDSLSAERSDRSRLSLTEPAELGRAEVQGEDVLITRLGSDGPPGFEVRYETFEASADVTQPRFGAFSAVGWDVDAQHLNAQLRLPPGWLLLTTSGADSSPTAWLHGWRLIDIFLLLLISFGIRTLFGNRLGALALVVLALAWHTPLLPQWLWLPFLITAAIAHALSNRSPARVAWALHAAASAVLVLAVAGHLGYELQTALFPALEQGGAGPEPPRWVSQDRFLRVSGDRASAPTGSYALEESADMADDMAVSRSALRREDARPAAPVVVVDPNAQLQTGPGMPTWHWQQHPISWSGPVASSQPFRLVLLPPWLVTLLRLLAAFGLVALLAGLSRAQITRWKDRPPSDSLANKDAPRTGPSGTSPTSAVGTLTLALLTGGGLAAIFPVSEAAADAFPPSALLQDLRSTLTADPTCGRDCVETQVLDVLAEGETLTLRAEVHAQTEGLWRAPGPLSAWSPETVLLNGTPTHAYRRGADQTLEVRVPAGVHRIELRGSLGDRLTLNLPHRPRVLRWTTTGWLLDGPRPDAQPPSSIHLSRDRDDSSHDSEVRPTPPTDASVQADLAPSLVLHRTLEFSHEGNVLYRLERDGGTNDALRIRIPRLAGEQLASEGVETEGDSFVVALERGQASTRWSTTLAPRDHFVLQAADEAPYQEIWTLHCTTLWSCTTEGIPPVVRMAPGETSRTWRPTWRPWPGEELTLRLQRPAAVPGQTTTVDEATLQVTDGRRLREVTLNVSLRSSHGGRWSARLPADAQLQRVTLQGRELPARAENGELTVTLPVGASNLQVVWQDTSAARFLARAPEVELQGGATNLRLDWQPASSRWLLWTQGPRWGPVVTLWHWLPVLLLLAFLLGRLAPTPLGPGAWLLLGLGMTQVSWLAPLAVVAWLLALAARERFTPTKRWAHNLTFLGLLLLTLLAAIALSVAILRGLALRPPSMQVMGGGSHDGLLRWYVDRTEGTLPLATVLSAPLWMWHLTMLAWALWLATALVKWVRWGWGALSQGGLWRAREPAERKPRLFHPEPLASTPAAPVRADESKASPASDGRAQPEPTTPEPLMEGDAPSQAPSSEAHESPKGDNPTDA